jgi:hypothetical protein
MIRWLRVVVPLSAATTLVVAYGVATAIALYVDWRVGVHLPEGRYVSRGILGGGAVFYALWRAWGFHPLLEPAYGAWLAATPWTSRKPLPLGPIHLVLQDVVAIGAMMVLGWLGCDGWPLFVPQIFLGVYSLALAASLFLTGVWPWGYAVMFGLGLAARLWRDTTACLGVETITYAAVYLGLRQSLALFPWRLVQWSSDFLMGMRPEGKAVAAERAAQSAFGWPFARLAPRFPGDPGRVPLYHAFLSSLLVGWWVFALTSHAATIANATDRHAVLFLSGLVAGIAAVVRVCVYCAGYWSPISFGGRLATGRLIIPGYDQVLVAPLLAMMAAGAIIFNFMVFDLNPLICLSTVPAVALFILLGMGPTLHAWRLTGNHRIVPGLQRPTGVKVG